MFQILLALVGGDRHGYAIMKEVERQTAGAVELGAGTLYRSIRQLVAAGLIAEVHPRGSHHRQRRYYSLTEAGRRRAVTEARRLETIIRWARAKHLLDTYET